MPRKRDARALRGSASYCAVAVRRGCARGMRGDPALWACVWSCEVVCTVAVRGDPAPWACIVVVCEAPEPWPCARAARIRHRVVEWEGRGSAEPPKGRQRFRPRAQHRESTFCVSIIF